MFPPTKFWIVAQCIGLFHLFAAITFGLLEYLWTRSPFRLISISNQEETSVSHSRLTLEALSALMKELQAAGSELRHLIEQVKSDKERLAYEVECTVEMLDELRETKGNVEYRLRQLTSEINNRSKAQDITFKRKMEIYNTNMCELYNFFDDKLLNHLIKMEKMESFQRRNGIETVESTKHHDAPATNLMGLDDEQKIWREEVIDDATGRIIVDLDEDHFVDEVDDW